MLPAPPTLGPRSPVARITVGPTPLWRVWHPGAHAHAGTDMRTYGPLLRFDPQPPPAADHPDIAVWYGADTLAVAVLERYARGNPVATICANARATLVRTAARTTTVDLDRDTPPDGLPTATPDLGTSTQADAYSTTQAWARSLHTLQGVHGITYRAASSDHLPGPRTATVLWAPSVIGAAQTELLLHSPTIWPRVQQALDGAGVATDKRPCTCSSPRGLNLPGRS